MNYQASFKQILKILKDTLSERKDSYKDNFDERLVQSILEQQISCPSIQRRLKEEFLGCGPLYSLVNDTNITEIILNGMHQVFFEKEGQIYHHKDTFLSSWTFENFIHRLLSQSKQALTIEKPFIDGKWGLFRFHIITSPITPDYTHITMRKHAKNSWTLTTLSSYQWAPDSALKIIRKLIQQKMNLLICGSTSSGKTSFLQACLNEIPKNERVISIEDTDELSPANPVSVKLLTRTGISSLPNINTSCLVKQSLRMRPDRIVMGEVRGDEAKDLMLALATGHAGSMGTIHASSHKQALARLELLAKGNTSWSSYSIQELIYLSIQVVIVLEKNHLKRQLKSIHQITGLEETGFLFETLFQRDSNLTQPIFTNRRWGLRHQT